MASRNKADLYPPLREVYEYGVMRWGMENKHLPQPFLTASYRANKEQDVLYNQPHDGKDNDGDGKIDERDEFVTNAKAGQSPHNYFPSLAFDIAFINNETNKLDWSPELFKKFYDFISEKYKDVITWGGGFKFRDYPHFEWKTWKDFKGK